MGKLRVGVIGLGMGRHHLMEFKKHPEVEVVAIADLDPKRLEACTQEFKVPAAYPDAEEMIKKEHLDIVSIATPNKFHKPLALSALKAGCHVLCEKPMAMNAAEGRQMVQAAQKANRRLMINFSYRFLPFSWALKKEVEAGTLGEIYFARTQWLRRKGIPGFGGWFGQKGLSGGGPLIDLGVHRLDLALWLMGYPKPLWVLAKTYNLLGKAEAQKARVEFDVEDFATALITFANGASLELSASWMGHIKERELMGTRLLGDKGGLIFQNIQGKYEFEAEIFLERNGTHYDMRPAIPATVPSAMAHFADSILKDVPHIATGEEGLTVMAILDAIYRSAEDGKPIKLGS